jgi:hypothetical protein
MKKLSGEQKENIVGGCNYFSFLMCLAECQMLGCTNPVTDCFWACQYEVTA